MDEPAVPLDSAAKKNAPPRAGWEEDFKAMARRGDDVLFDGDVIIPTRWDEEEWEWKDLLSEA